MRNPASTRRMGLGLLFLLAGVLTVAAQRNERLPEGWRPLHYEVSLTFDDELTQLTRARTEITVEFLRGGLSVLDFDFGKLTVDEVTFNGKPARFEQSDGRLNVTVPEKLPAGERARVAVGYHGQPADGLILTKDKDGQPSAVGDNWPDRVHHWIPCLDHPSAKATVRFTIHAPARYLATANGKLEKQQPEGAQTVWTYYEKTPIPPYCLVVAVGAFALTQPATPATVPLLFYTPRSEGVFAPRGFAAAAPSVEMFSRLIAPFPYDKLALIVGATQFGGMENSGAIVFARTLFDERGGSDLSARFGIRRGIVDVTAHEIAHQWFGDDVTEATWADLWLSEGFATYCAGLFIAQHEGDAAFREYMQRAAASVFGYDKTHPPPIHDTTTPDLFKLLNANNYQKGAWVLHILRGQLGDAVFFRGLRLYYDRHKHATATTEDLRAALEQVSGRDLRPFFRRWVYETGHPRLQTGWSWRKGQLTICAQQTQAEAPFSLDLPLSVTVAGDTQQATLKIQARAARLRLPLKQAPQQVAFDPRGTLLAEIAPTRKQCPGP